MYMQRAISQDVTTDMTSKKRNKDFQNRLRKAPKSILSIQNAETELKSVYLFHIFVARSQKKNTWVLMLRFLKSILRILRHCGL